MTARSTTQTPADPIRAALADMVIWSDGLPVWQQDALRRLYVTGKLTSTDMAELSKICRQPHALLKKAETPITAEPLEFTHFPAESGPAAPVALRSIGQAKNVNALADGQTLNFAESGLTIVYGDNGAGKSGYGRILKRACRARDQEEIMGNVYAPAAGVASARIQFSVGGVSRPPLLWQNGTSAAPELSTVSVFDSKCASVHVDGHNELGVHPRSPSVAAIACRCLPPNRRDSETGEKGAGHPNPGFPATTSITSGHRCQQPPPGPDISHKHDRGTNAESTFRG